MKCKQSLTYRLGILLAIGGLCATLPGCVNKAQPNFQRPPAPVVVSTAVSQDVSNYMDALGKIVAKETVSIQPQVSGRIEKIHFTDGANVKKGQLLFTIDPRPFEANLKQAQAHVVAVHPVFLRVPIQSEGKLLFRLIRSHTDQRIHENLADIHDLLVQAQLSRTDAREVGRDDWSSNRNRRNDCDFHWRGKACGLDRIGRNGHRGCGFGGEHDGTGPAAE